jgi:SAM-dependent methyltransferase
MGGETLTMRRHELNLDDYDTDKVTNGYLATYDPVLAPYVDRELKMLELGVHRGGSLRLWRDYFARGEITGVDSDLPENVAFGERVQAFQGDQGDTAFLTGVARRVAPDGFDVIIDDASHLGEVTKRSFWHLFEHHLKPGGLYVIEDWGTGYWSDWPDGRAVSPDAGAVRPVDRARARLLRWASERLGGRSGVPLASHDAGMVGFIKQLVDEQGAADMTRRQMVGTSTRVSRFKNLLIAPSIVFVTKAGGD